MTNPKRFSKMGSSTKARAALSNPPSRPMAASVAIAPAPPIFSWMSLNMMIRRTLTGATTNRPALRVEVRLCFP